LSGGTPNKILIRLKSNILAAPKFLSWLRYCCRAEIRSRFLFTFFLISLN